MAAGAMIVGGVSKGATGNATAGTSVSALGTDVAAVAGASAIAANASTADCWAFGWGRRSGVVISSALLTRAWAMCFGVATEVVGTELNSTSAA